MMMKAFPRPRERFDVNLRTIMSAGEAVGTDGVRMGARRARRHHQRDVRPDRDELHRRQLARSCGRRSRARWGARIPGTGSRVIDDDGSEVARRRDRRGRGEPHRARRHARSGLLPRVLQEPGRRRAKKFTGDWCRTGDLAKRDDDGYLWYQGRADDMFKAAGYRIGPSEIENCLVQAIPRSPMPRSCRRPTRRAATSSRRSSCSPPGTRRRRRSRTTSSSTCASYLAPYEYPKEIEFIDALPMTTTGKVQRRVLRERERERKAGEAG